MDDDPPEPEPEKPRFLLPDGCKDLIDVLRLQRAEAPPLRKFSPNAKFTFKPSSVAIPEATSVEDLATALNFHYLDVIAILLQLVDLGFLPASGFILPKTELDFATASAVCAHLGIAVTKLNPPP